MVKDREEHEKAGLKIADRRRFTDSGEERVSPEEQTQNNSEANREVKSSVGEIKDPGGTLSEQWASTSNESKEPQVTFSSFIMSLATQALMQLGEIKAPDGVQIPIDREGARHAIDILGLIKDKTRGNLDSDEARLIDEILHSVRMCYLRTAK